MRPIWAAFYKASVRDAHGRRPDAPLGCTMHQRELNYSLKKALFIALTSSITFACRDQSQSRRVCPMQGAWRCFAEEGIMRRTWITVVAAFTLASCNDSVVGPTDHPLDPATSAALIARGFDPNTAKDYGDFVIVEGDISLRKSSPLEHDTSD